MRYRVFKQDGMWCVSHIRDGDKPGYRRSPVAAAQRLDEAMNMVCRSLSKDCEREYRKADVANYARARAH